ncbi:MAG: isochorismatase family protein [Acidimicrobiia bacterium]|nr:isochorismatase family protein [Acidimicrobiia bacterium]MYC44014.1 isochorismatase family protein [Acidimicrobiia bacterium]MYI20872.1 isochorismatase family protein [Acidimicrobiia bacterium]
MSGQTEERRSWLASIPGDDLDVYELSGFGGPSGFGDHPALLVIDVQYRTAGDRPVPIREAITTMYPTACGDRAWAAIPHIARLLRAARAAGIPIIYPYVAPKKAVDAGRFGSINPAITSISERGYEFVDEVAPEDGDVLLPKRHASAFFGTALVSYLVDFGVDTVILAGCTTSGCIRATAVDAFSYNFRTIVPEECVYDRIQASHDVGLFDLDAKYADVMPAEAVIDRLRESTAPPG